MDANRFMDIQQEYIREQRAFLDRLEKITQCEYRTLDIDCSKIDELLFNTHIESFREAGIRRNMPVLYYFVMQMGDQMHEVQNTLKKMKTGPGKSNLALPRINNISDQTTPILYVGKSWDFIARYKQHLGLSHPSTYSLHLNKWADGLGLQLRVYYMLCIEGEMLDQLESILHFGLKPILGREGH